MLLPIRAALLLRSERHHETSSRRVVLDPPGLGGGGTERAGCPANPRAHARQFRRVDETCGFPVEVHQTGFIIVIQWVDADGSLRRFEAYPEVTATFTNQSTGQSVTVNLAGTAHITEGADGSFTLIGTGNWGFNHHPDTDEPGIFVL